MKTQTLYWYTLKEQEPRLNENILIKWEDSASEINIDLGKRISNNRIDVEWDYVDFTDILEWAYV